MWLSSCGSAISSKVTDTSHQPATSITTMVAEMLNFMDEDSLACAWGILGLDVPEQKKGCSKLLLKYILR